MINFINELMFGFDDDGVMLVLSKKLYKLCLFILKIMQLSW